MMVRGALASERGKSVPLRVLVVHNRYQRPGGEDTVVEAEVDLLRSMGVEVFPLIYDSQDEAKMRRLKRRPDELVFNRGAYAEAVSLMRRHQIQVVHCHNLVPLLSPSIYSAAAAIGAPVVQTVHNYRMGCLNGLHLRGGEICELCRPGYHLPGMVLGCYRNSRVQSVAFGLAQTANRWRGAWRRPALYLTPGNSLREHLIAWGIPPEQIVVKPHFVKKDPGQRTGPGTHALFVGRLSPEKGLNVLLDVWDADRPPLMIAGDGPLRGHLECRVRREGRRNVHVLGHQDRESVNALLRDSRFLVVPSVWRETFGLVVIEAYAHGIPVIATRLGTLADLVQDGVTGRLVQPNDRADLATKLTELTNDMEKTVAMGRAARSCYEEHYSADANAAYLREVYDRVLRGKVPGDH